MERTTLNRRDFLRACALAAGLLVVGALGGCTPELPLSPTPEGHVVAWGWESAMRDALAAAGIVEAFHQVYPDVEVEIVYVNHQEL